MTHYVPKPDAEGINTTEKPQPIKDFVVLAVGFLLTVFLAYAFMGKIAEWIFARISVEKEIEIIDRYLGESPRESQALPPELQVILDRLRRQTGFPLKMEIKCDSEPNAFVFPGARIVLTEGLFSLIKSENGLVFIIGHEIGHIVHRDHLRGLGRGLVTLLFNFIIGRDADLYANLEIFQLVVARTYSQKQEIAADEFALALTKRIYGHTSGADEFFQAMSERESVFDRSIGDLVSTHPPSSERAAKIRASQDGESDLTVRPSRPFSEWLKPLCSSS